MKRVKLFALISLLFIGLGHAWGENATYTKVTSSLADWSGDYLIVYESGNVAFNGSLTTLDATNNGTAVTISDGSITTDSKYEFHITKDGDVYYIQSASGYYIWGTSSNGLSSNTTKSSAKGNSISYSNGTFTIKGNDGTKTLSYNTASDQKRFRYLGTTLIQLYRKTGSSGGVTYTDDFFQQAGTHTTPTCLGKRSRYVPPAYPDSAPTYSSHLRLFYFSLYVKDHLRFALLGYGSSVYLSDGILYLQIQKSSKRNLLLTE